MVCCITLLRYRWFNNKRVLARWERELIMSNETLEELKAIVDKAPFGATHFDNKKIYYKATTKGTRVEWVEFTAFKTSFQLSLNHCMHDIRSLSDIERIIELEQRVKDCYE